MKISKLFAFSMLGLALGFGGAVSTSMAKGKDHKVTICHMTSSEKNPVVVIRVDKSAVPAHKAHGDIILGDVDPKSGKSVCEITTPPEEPDDTEEDQPDDHEELPT